MYHRFANHDVDRQLRADIFERQVRILRRHFNVISLKSLCSTLVAGEPVPPHAVVLTIDDGYGDFYYFGFPLLRRYSLPATIYITTDFVDKKIWLWPDRIEHVLAQTKHRDYSLSVNSKTFTLRLNSSEQRRSAWREIAGYCLGLRNEEKDVVIDEIARDLGVSVPATPSADYAALTWEQVREMKHHGIDVGSHTCTHPRLVRVDNAALSREINHSKRRIEHMIDDTVASFAYPFGDRCDYDDNIKSLVKAAGYENAVVAYFDGDTTKDLFALRRSSIGSNLGEFKDVVFGAQYLSASIKRSTTANL